jgi:CHAT domain-containing protein
MVRLKNLLIPCFLVVTMLAHAQDYAQFVAVEEAKAVRPPRSVSDVFKMLDQHQPDPRKIKAMIAEADATPGPGMSDRELCLFYQNRSLSAAALGRLGQAESDAQKAIDVTPKSDRLLVSDSYSGAASAAMAAGQPLRAIEYIQQGTQVMNEIREPAAGFLLGSSRILLTSYLMLGDTVGAEKANAQLAQAFAEVQTYKKGWPEWQDHWTQNYRVGRGTYFLGIGKPVEAEFEFLRAKEAIENQKRRQESGEFSGSTRRPQQASSIAASREQILRLLGKSTIDQGKPALSEYYYREALKGTLTELSRASPRVALSLSGLSHAVAEQGRLDESVQLSKAALQSMKESGSSETSLNVIEARRAYADALSTNGNYKQAIEQYGLMKQSLAQNLELQNRLQRRGDFEEIIALLEVGQTTDAEQLSRALSDGLTRKLGEGHPRAAMAQAFYATSLDRSGKYTEAVDRFSKSVPVLVSQAQQNSEAGAQSIRQQKRLSIVIEGYIDALFKSGAGNKEQLGLAFQLSDIAKGSNVQKAMTQSTARAAIKDPTLAELARKEQDAQRQIQSLTELQASLAAAPASQQLPGIQSKLTSDVDKLKTQRDELRKDIARKFPEYAELVDPKPVTVERTAKQIQAGEVLVNWFLGDWASYVWVISNKGLIGSSVLPVTRAQVASDVTRLRKSLDPNVSSVDEIPPYDLALSNALYTKLLAPVKSSLDGQKVLLAVPHAELAQLPIAILTTKPFAQPGKGSQNFAGYRNAPWLVRDVAILQLPSVTALTALRAGAKSTENAGTFIGFGDPYFSPDQAGGYKVADSGAMASRGKPLKLRSAPNTRGVSSAELALLPRLPDTEVEVKDVAAVFKADPDKDIYIHERASVTNVLNADLSKKSVVMFSTHGLVPGDLDGLTQPALAMSSPLVTGEKQGDGLLKMDQVLNLKLNADWVVLSACNTAAGSGRDTEAVSGLGRAFFYAGARAMLVSNWPVDTVSSRILMVDLFKRQQEKKIGKPEALRQSELELADKGGTSGYAYAHPLFWAPFVVIGD